MKQLFETLLTSEYLLEARRKVSHIVFGLTILFSFFGNWYTNLENTIYIRIIIIAIYMVITNVRIIRNNIPNISWFIKNLFERKDTFISGIGGLTLLLGIILPILLGFDERIIVIIALTLCLGDGMATLIGTYLGKYSIKIGSSRSLLGSFGGLVSIIIGLYFFDQLDSTSIFAAIIGMTIELILGIIPKKLKNIVRWYSLDNIIISLVLMFIL